MYRLERRAWHHSSSLSSRFSIYIRTDFSIDVVNGLTNVTTKDVRYISISYVSQPIIKHDSQRKSNLFCLAVDVDVDYEYKSKRIDWYP
jgi:hypothetical protein